MLHLKGTGHPLTCLYRPKAEAQVYFQSIRNLTVEGARWPAPRSGFYALGISRYLLYKRLGDPQGRFGGHAKSTPLSDSIPGPYSL